MHTPDVMILGASARAAAQSASRAGLRPVCADLFADDDLRAIAELLPLESYPHGLPRAARSGPAGPWMYTGSVENHPSLLEEISAERPLWGNPADVVRRVRDPLWLAAVLGETGLPAAAVRRADDPPPPDGCWLLKPLRGAAGRGIVVWDDAAADSKTLREPHYFQQRLDGVSLSAVYLAWPGRTVLVGLARQIIGRKPADAAGFTYCGSLGPIRLDDATTRQARCIGEVIARRADLRGLFGIDLLHDGRGVRPVEVNPRYTASVEIYELAHGVALLDAHRRACEAHEAAERVTDVRRNPVSFGNRVSEVFAPVRTVGKFVWYTDRDLTAPALDAFLPPLAEGRFPALADIPRLGSHVAAGQPVCTVLAAGRDVADCAAELGDAVARLVRSVTGAEPHPALKIPF